MSRQEALNTFTDGLVMDLNPLTTPNNVLTDCLNGTVITYNDNEFILQNDQGNYKLENCKLKPNFIPVGIKEHANILYIVSYNPITKETEIGSYPSPRTIFTSEINSETSSLLPIINNNDYNLELSKTYEEWLKTQSLVIYTNPENMQEWFINPGDQFKIELDTDILDLKFKYQGLKFFILDESKNLIPIDSEIMLQYLNDSEFQYVFWETPGWLAVRYDLANLDTFTIGVRSFTLPEFIVNSDSSFDVSNLTLNCQVEFSDKLFFDEFGELYPELREHLKVDVIVTKKDDSSWKIVINDNDLQYITYPNFTIGWVNVECGIVPNLNINDTLVITAVPKIVNNVEVVYKQFETTINLRLNSIESAKDVFVAKNKYTYYVSDKEVLLTFDVNGPFSTNSQVTLSYIIYDIDGNVVIDAEVKDKNLMGQNILSIEFNDSFKKEDIYLISFFIKEGDVVLNRTNKILITSELFNSFKTTYSDFNTIPGDQWMPKFIDTFNWIAQPNLTKTSIPNISDPTYNWIQTFPQKDEYVQESKFNATIPPAEFKVSSKVDCDFNFSGELTHLTGPLWNSLQLMSTLTGKFADTPINYTNYNSSFNDSISFESEAYIYKNAKILNKGSEMGILATRSFFKEGFKHNISTRPNIDGPELMFTSYYKNYNGTTNDWELRMYLNGYDSQEKMANDQGFALSSPYGVSGIRFTRDRNEWTPTVFTQIRNIMQKHNCPIALVRLGGTDGAKDEWTDNTEINALQPGLQWMNLSSTENQIPWYYFLMQYDGDYFNGKTKNNQTLSKSGVIWILPKSITEIIVGNGGSSSGSEQFTLESDFNTMYSILKKIGDYVYLVTSKKSGYFDYFDTGEDYVTTKEQLDLEFNDTVITTTLQTSPKYKVYEFWDSQNSRNLLFEKLKQIVEDDQLLNNNFQVVGALPNITFKFPVNVSDLNIHVNANSFQEDLANWNVALNTAKTNAQEKYIEMFNDNEAWKTKNAGEIGVEGIDGIEWEDFVNCLGVLSSSSQPYQLKDVCVKSISGNVQGVELFREGGDAEHGIVGTISLNYVSAPSK